jgi:hypothetical protein
MKRSHTLLLAILVVSGVSAQNLDTVPANRAHQINTLANTQAPVKPSKHWPTDRQATKTKLAGLKADVVNDMRTTSVFVEQRAGDPAAPSRWLIGLAAVGLVMIQLRRKHRSLPLQRITPYG